MIAVLKPHQRLLRGGKIQRFVLLATKAMSVSILNNVLANYSGTVPIN